MRAMSMTSAIVRSCANGVSRRSSPRGVSDWLTAYGNDQRIGAFRGGSVDGPGSGAGAWGTGPGLGGAAVAAWSDGSAAPEVRRVWSAVNGVSTVPEGRAFSTEARSIPNVIFTWGLIVGTARSPVSARAGRARARAR